MKPRVYKSLTTNRIILPELRTSAEDEKMAYWQDYWIAAPIVLASLAAGLATFKLLDKEDLAADNEKRCGASEAGAASSLDKI